MSRASAAASPSPLAPTPGPASSKDQDAAESSSSAVVTEEVKQTLEKGMRIISDIEQTRADGMVFKFEMDLMYEVRARHRSVPGLSIDSTTSTTTRLYCCLLLDVGIGGTCVREEQIRVAPESLSTVPWSCCTLGASVSGTRCFVPLCICRDSLMTASSMPGNGRARELFPRKVAPRRGSVVWHPYDA